jgi:hypothetical protein
MKKKSFYFWNFWNGGAAKKTAVRSEAYTDLNRWLLLCELGRIDVQDDMLRRTRSAGAGDLLIINEPWATIWVTVAAQACS